MENKVKRGTPCYMAPELFQGASYSVSSDFWSLGCVLYELASGSPPFVSNNFEELAHMIINNAFKPLEQYSSEFNDLLNGLLQKNPADRFSWDELREHEFWKESIQEPPEQDRKHLVVSRQENKQKAPQIPLSQNVVRLSCTIQKNAAKEKKEDSQANNAPRKITDMEYNFDEEANAAASDDDKEPTNLEDGAIDDENSQQPPLTQPLIAQYPQTQSLQQHADGSQALIEIQSAPIPQTPGQTVKSHIPLVVPDIGSAATTPLDMKHFDSLLFTSSDSIAKPIVKASKHERIMETKFDKGTLPFPAHSLDTMIALSQTELEKFLTQVYKALASLDVSVSKKLDILCYFETMCSDTHSANILINSILMSLFVKMLKTYKSPTIRCRLCWIMGLLIRHATFISRDIFQTTNVFDVFIQLSRDSNIKVKRRAICTLGELMFYVAATSEEQWIVPREAIALMAKCLKLGEDEMIQRYAARTIENMAAHSAEYACKFSTPDTISLIVSLVQHTPNNESLRATSLSTLSRLCRHSPAQLSISVIEQLTIPNVTSLLFGEHNPKIQQWTCNLVNISLLAEPQPISNVDTQSQKPQIHPTIIQLLEQDLFMDQMLDMLEHTSVTIRGKALITLYLLSRKYLQLFFKMFDHRLCQILEKNHIKEKDIYARKCQSVLVDVIVFLVPSLVKQVAHILVTELHHGLPSSATKCLHDISIVCHVVATPFLASLVVNDQFIDQVATCLANIPCDTGTGHGLNIMRNSQTDEFVKTLLLVVEAISQQQSLVAQVQVKSIVEHLLVALLKTMENGVGDTRFICLKIVTDMLLRYLNDPQVYQHIPQEQQQQQQPESSMPSIPARISPVVGNEQETNKMLIDRLILNHLLPLYKSILEDKDPVPLFGLKLLNHIAERNSFFIEPMHELGLVPKLFEFFELEHRNNNVHNVRLILKVISASANTSLAAMYQMGIVTKLNQVLGYAYDNGVDSFFEPCLSIVDHLFYRASKLIQRYKTEKTPELQRTAEQMYQNNEQLIQNLRVYMALCCHQDICVAESSAHVMLLIAQQYATSHENIFSPTGLAHIRKCLLRIAEPTNKISSDCNLINQVDDSVSYFVLKMVLLIVQSNRKWVNKLQRDEQLYSGIRKLAELQACSKISEIAKQVEKIVF